MMTDISGKTINRYSEIDIMRGMGIIFVVMLHVGIGSKFWTDFFGAFHMAVFFFCSGFCYRDKKVSAPSESLKYMLNKVKALYIPYVIFNSTLILLNNVFIRINVYTDNKAFGEAEIGIANFFGLKQELTLIDMINQIKGILLFGKQGEPQLGGATWFLRVLFFVSVFFFLVDLTIKYLIRSKTVKMYMHVIIASILLGIGWYAHCNSIMNYYQIFTCCSIYFVYVFGYLFKQLHVNELIYKKKVYLAIIFTISFIALSLLTPKAKIGINANNYYNPIYLFLVSCFGSLFTYISACYIDKIAVLKCALILLGRNSLYIMMLHFLSFKIIIKIIIIMKAYPAYYLASFPVLDSFGYWRTLYILVGLFVPTFLVWCMRGLKKMLRRPAMKSQA